MPPPINGHSIVSKVLLESISEEHTVDLVNLSKTTSKNINGHVSFARIREILSKSVIVAKNSRKVDIIYLTISESFIGNVKDILFYILSFNKLYSFYIHLHGGSIKRLLWDKSRLLYRINKYFISKLGGVIISGDSHRSIFEDMLPAERIHIVKNFADDDIFVQTNEIDQKFANNKPIELLYLSSFHVDKGYDVLLRAFLTLSREDRSAFRLNFAGKFYDEDREQKFLENIAPHQEVVYHGMVEDVEKSSLYRKSHVFILPTMYLEGQPLSILDAYAAGCFVITTGLGGIPDIFRDKVNGYQISPDSVESMVTALDFVRKNFSSLKKVASCNFEDANTNYRRDNYTASIKKIIQINH